MTPHRRGTAHGITRSFPRVTHSQLVADQKNLHLVECQARHCRDRLQAQAPQRSQGSMGGTKPNNLTQDKHNGVTSKATELFCSQQITSTASPFVWWLLRKRWQLMQDPPNQNRPRRVQGLRKPGHRVSSHPRRSSPSSGKVPR